jgi:hypothetical protein
VIVVVISVVVSVMVVITSAAAPHFFQFLMALVGLPTVFAVTVDGVAQFFFGLMDASFAFVVTVGTCWHR